MSAPGVLHIVATPIGNLEDVTARALRVLREVDLIAAEDTRVTKNLLRHFGIPTPLVRHDAHVEHRGSGAILDRLMAGQSVALVCDAGTPLLSDPGQELVAEAVKLGIRVEPVPGPSALLAALVASGLPVGRFVFEGFLPRSNDRRERLIEIAREPRTVVLYEGPHRVKETLADLASVCGPERGCAAGREITKKFEEFVRGTLAEVAAHFDQHEPRGEFVLVLGPGSGPPPEELAVSVEVLLTDALARGLSTKDAAREVAVATGRSRRDLYALVTTLRLPSDPL